MHYEEKTKTIRRVAMFMANLDAGGAEAVQLHLAGGFLDKGIEVDLVLATPFGPFRCRIPAGVNVVELNCKNVSSSVLPLARYLRRNPPDALYSALNRVNVVALIAKGIARSRVPVVVANHGIASAAVELIGGIGVRIIHLLARWYFPKAHQIVTVSERSADDLAAELHLRREDIKVILNPVVSPEILRRAKEPIDCAWYRESETPLIVAVGRLSAAKDYPTLLRAANIVKNRRSVRLLVLGDGEDRKPLEALAAELGFDPEEVFPGFVENPYAFLSRASVYVLSSISEALPLALIEAMACGAPVVATDCVSGPSEILKGGALAPLVEVKNPDALARAIETTLDTPPEVEALIKRAMEYTVSAATKAYLRVLDPEPLQDVHS